MNSPDRPDMTDTVPADGPPRLVADPPEPRPALPLNARGGPFERIKDHLWGYDFFISYHWASGGQYAVNLAQRLRDRHYDVFLDRAEYASGDNWQAFGRIALANTKRLVLVGVEGANHVLECRKVGGPFRAHLQALPTTSLSPFGAFLSV